MDVNSPITGPVVGVVGGGQLARMMAPAATHLGVDLRVLAETPEVSAVAAVIDSYLRLVERDPELYRFVVRRPLADVDPEADPVAGLTDAIAARLQTILLAAMTHPDPEAARIWGHGLVGFVREAADRWLSEPDRIPRDDIVGHLARFAGAGITGILQSTSHR